MENNKELSRILEHVIGINAKIQKEEIYSAHNAMVVIIMSSLIAAGVQLSPDSPYVVDITKESAVKALHIILQEIDSSIDYNYLNSKTEAKNVVDEMFKHHLR